MSAEGMEPCKILWRGEDHPGMTVNRTKMRGMERQHRRIVVSGVLKLSLVPIQNRTVIKN